MLVASYRTPVEGTSVVIVTILSVAFSNLRTYWTIMSNRIEFFKNQITLSCGQLKKNKNIVVGSCAMRGAQKFVPKEFVYF